MIVILTIINDIWLKILDQTSHLTVQVELILRHQATIIESMV